MNPGIGQGKQQKKSILSQSLILLPSRVSVEGLMLLVSIGHGSLKTCRRFKSYIMWFCSYYFESQQQLNKMEFKLELSFLQINILSFSFSDSELELINHNLNFSELDNETFFMRLHSVGTKQIYCFLKCTLYEKLSCQVDFGPIFAFQEFEDLFLPCGISISPSSSSPWAWCLIMKTVLA